MFSSGHVMWLLAMLVLTLINESTHDKGAVNSTVHPDLTGFISNSTDHSSNTTANSSTLVKPSLPAPLVLPANHTRPANDSSPEPVFVVESARGSACVLASFNVSLRISYGVKSQTRSNFIAFKDITVPADAEISQGSFCGKNVSSLVLEWGNSTFNLNLTFVTHDDSKGDMKNKWTVDSVALGYNLSNDQVFPGAVKDNEYVSVEASDLNLFPTEIGHAKECDDSRVVELGTNDRGADVTFYYVILAAFNLTSEEFPTDVDECEAGSWNERKEDILVPLIIACNLSLVVIIVVIAYAISRKVQEARDQSQYKPMP